MGNFYTTFARVCVCVKVRQKKSEWKSFFTLAC